MTEPATLRTDILVVEDDTMVAAVLRDLLEDEGYCVIHVADGKAALEGLATHGEHVGVILLDTHMPRMNGSEFRRHQLRDPQIAHIPVVVMTAGVRIDPELQPTVLLRSPLNADTLLAVIERLLEQPKPQ